MRAGWPRIPRPSSALYTGAALVVLLWRMGFGRLAVPTALAVALGSDLWVVGSQSLLQHGSAALALTCTLALLVAEPVSRLRLFLAGLATAALVCFRPQDLLLAVVIFLWVARYHFRDLAWFLPMPFVLGGALVGYNYWFFELPGGGYQWVFGEERSAATFSSPLVAGAAGTFLSPNRGLFIFTPWTALALAYAPVAAAGKLSHRSIVWWLLWTLVPFTYLLASFPHWHGGCCFGPRFWTDVMPLFAVLLGFGLAWAWEQSKPLAVIFGVAVIFSIGVQAIGAWCYPSSWEDEPTTTERLWDWNDTELGRCLIEGPSKWVGAGVSRETE